MVAVLDKILVIITLRLVSSSLKSRQTHAVDYEENLLTLELLTVCQPPAQF